jgi:hypothetical protein
MDSPYTKKEIWEVLKSFAKDKIPGPDGWIVEFFLHFFDLVGVELLEMVEDTRTSGKVIGCKLDFLDTNSQSKQSFYFW